MEVAKLGLIFCIIVVIIWLKYPLYLAMTAGILSAILLFQIPVTEALLLLGRQTIAWETIDLLLSFYVIIFLQLMMEKKGRLKNARDSFDHLLRNRRLNTIISPAIMGLCMIFVIMFIVGMFVQTTPAIVILAPTLLAVVSQVGIDPIHFGIIMTLALAIAFVTPPVALNLFVGSSMTGLSIDKIVRAFMPFLIGLIVAFFIVSFVPAISLGVLGDWSLTFG